MRQDADYFAQYDAVSPLQHYWSLAVEEQFYLVLPALFLLTMTASVHRRGARRIRNWRLVGTVSGLSALSLAWCIYSTAASPATAYFSSLARAWQLGFGGLLALLLVMRPIRVRQGLADVVGLVGLLGLGASFVFLRGESYPGVLALLPVAAALCVLASGAWVQRAGVTQRLLSLRALTLTGMVSFSLYLWHWPVIIFAYRFWPAIETHPVRVPVLLAAALILSATTYALVERPKKSLSLTGFAQRRPGVVEYLRKDGPLAALAAAVVVMAVMALTPTTISTADRAAGVVVAPAPAQAVTGEGRDAWQAVLDESLDLDELPDDLTPALADVPEDREPGGCLNVSEANMDDCIWGDATATKLVVVVGDSHAEMWLTAIRQAFPAAEYNVQALNHGGCTNADITRREDVQPTLGQVCDAHRRWNWEKIAELQPDVVVMSDFAGFVNWTAPDGRHMVTGTREAWKEGLTRSLAKIKPHTEKIVLIGQTPRGKTLAECLPRDLSLRPCYGDDAYMSGQRAIERQLVLAADGVFVDPGAWLCRRGQCPPVIDKTVVFFDDNHLTLSMQRKFAPLLLRELQPTLARSEGGAG